MLTDDSSQLLALEKVKSVEEYQGDDGSKGKVLLLKARNECERRKEGEKTDFS